MVGEECVWVRPLLEKVRCPGPMWISTGEGVDWVDLNKALRGDQALIPYLLQTNTKVYIKALLKA